MYLIPIQYGKKTYPQGIKTKIRKIAGHFDMKRIYDVTSFSLHTD